MSTVFSKLDGSGRNPAHPEYGTTSQPLEYHSIAPAYGDNVSSPAGTNRPSPRLISNQLFSSPFKWNTVNDANAWFPYYGQWLAHDMILTTGPGPNFNIPVPPCDYFFDK